MQEMGLANSERDAARKIAEVTGETKETVRNRIRRGKGKVGQHDQRRHTPDHKSENLMRVKESPFLKEFYDDLNRIKKTINDIHYRCKIKEVQFRWMDIKSRLGRLIRDFTKGK